MIDRYEEDMLGHELHGWCVDAQAEIDALRKDAERYRWLRDVASGGDWEHIGQNTDPTNTDVRVDECMEAYKAVGAA